MQSQPSKLPPTLWEAVSDPEGCRFDARHRCFVVGPTTNLQRLMGLHAHLRRELWPLLGVCMKAKKARKAGAAARSSAWGGGAAGGSSTKALGSRVDDELSSLAAGEMPEDPKKLHLWTRRLIVALAKHGLEPVAAQIPLWCAAQNVGSAADCLLWHRESKAYYLMELKTGADAGSKARSLGRLPSPMNALRINPYTQRHIQAAWYAAVMSQHYGVPLAGTFVAVSNSKGVVLEPLDEAVAPFASWLISGPALGTTPSAVVNLSVRLPPASAPTVKAATQRQHGLARQPQAVQRIREQRERERGRGRGHKAGRDDDDGAIQSPAKRRCCGVGV